MKQAKNIFQIVLALLLVIATIAFVLDKSQVDAAQGVDNNIKFQKTIRTSKPNWKHPLGNVHFLPAQFSTHLLQFRTNDSNISVPLKKNS
jgi:hypothetical protein